MNPNELAHDQGAVEVRLFEGTKLVAIERCETREEAEQVARRWEEREGAEAVISDLAHESDSDEPLQLEDDDL